MIFLPYLPYVVLASATLTLIAAEWFRWGFNVNRIGMAGMVTWLISGLTLAVVEISL